MLSLWLSIDRNLGYWTTGSVNTDPHCTYYNYSWMNNYFTRLEIYVFTYALENTFRVSKYLSNVRIFHIKSLVNKFAVDSVQYGYQFQWTGATLSMSSIILILIKISSVGDNEMRWAKHNFHFHSKSEILDLKGKERQKITPMYHVYSCYW